VIKYVALCNSGITRFLQSSKGLDVYLQSVDQTLCSPECPCKITTTAFENDSNVKPYFDKWYKTNGFGVTTFQECSPQVQLNAYKQAAAADKDFDPDKNFDQQRFWNYMIRLENEFSCSGWCDVRYMNNNGDNMIIYKYLFSGINRGPPKKFGCLEPIVEWLRPYLIAYGSLTITIAVFQVYCI
jgi:hypothetical protein